MAQDMVLDRKRATSAIPQRRKLTLTDVRDIATKVTKSRLSESEACYSLNINPKQWFNFKQKHKAQEQFNAMIETIRAAQLENCVQVIDSHGDGITYTKLNKQGEVVELTKPGDWRAKAWIAERILAPERLGQQQSAPTATVNVYNQLGISIDEIGSKVYAARQSKAIDVQAASKQLTDTKP